MHSDGRSQAVANRPIAVLHYKGLSGISATNRLWGINENGVSP